MGLSPHAVVNNANGKLLAIDMIRDDVHKPTPQRMAEITRLCDEYRAAVTGCTTDPFRTRRT